MTDNYTPFGTFVEIDVITNGPKFTFMYQPTSPQYVLISSNDLNWRSEFVANWEDCEVGNGFLTLIDYESGGMYRQFTFFVDFYHDGDPTVEVWGFKLHLMYVGDPLEIEAQEVTPVSRA